MSDWPVYTVEKPCRCGFDGDGEHRCHAGRDPRCPGGRCANPAEPGRFVAKPLGSYSIAGTQMKFVGDYYHYCATCWRELETEKSRENRQ